MEEDISRLTTALSRGDEGAWRDFHTVYYPRIYRWLLALAHGDEDEAAEAAHLTFLRAVRRVPRTGEAAALWRWLTRLARCAYVDEWRRRKSRGALLKRWLDSSGPPGIAPPDTDPLERLEECLATLDHDDRLLLEAKYFERRSVQSLAGERRVTEKALESRLTRARLRLREAFCQHMKHAD